MNLIPEELFRLLQLHTGTAQSMSPMGVIHLAAALAGAPTSVVSAASVESDEASTRWVFDLIADGTLAHGVVEYDRSDFAWEDEAGRFGPAPTKTVREAWVRPLNTVTALAVSDVWRAELGIAIGELTLTFADGFKHNLPAQDRLYRTHEVQRAEDFHAALRTGIGF